MKLINTATLIAAMVAAAAPSTAAAAAAATGAQKNPEDKSSPLRASPNNDRILYSGHGDYSPYNDYYDHQSQTQVATLTRFVTMSDNSYCTFGFEHETDYRTLGDGPNAMICNGNICGVDMAQMNTAIGINLERQCGSNGSNGSKYDAEFTVECFGGSDKAVALVTCPSGMKMNRIKRTHPDQATFCNSNDGQKGCSLPDMEPGKYELICQDADNFSGACPGDALP